MLMLDDVILGIIKQIYSMLLDISCIYEFVYVMCLYNIHPTVCVNLNLVLIPDIFSYIRCIRSLYWVILIKNLIDPIF